MKYKNKKGLATPIIISLVAVGLILALLLLPSVLGGGTATNIGNEPKDCKKQTFTYEVSGDIVVKDAKIIGVEPTAQKFENLAFRRLAFFEPFDYEVELFDSQSGKKLSSFRGSSDLSSKVKSKNVPFQLPFNIDDCDGVIDAQLQIKAKLVETQDVIKDESRIEQSVSIRGGRIQ